MKKATRRVWSIFLAFMMLISMLPMSVSAEGEDGVVWYNDSAYQTLSDAVADIHKLTGDARMEEHVITLKDNVTCSGFGVGYESLSVQEQGFATTSGNNPVNVTIDLKGFTYTVTAQPTVGSGTTETNGFQFLKGSKVTIKNGTIKADESKNILFQNYCDLTLENVDVSATKSTYVVSNNCGDVRFIGNTSLTGSETGHVFDVCVTSYYPEGVNVTVDTTGTISGDILYDVWGEIPNPNKA